ncbi:hypothetical protein [Agromyces luteolus]|uniref:Glycosyltransferase RgtA/B/C/D-like domain-containing protein n=1 Tax=Agromyces luteolus TaxID=88373 RepID=A0A7C9LSS3_9MICO|nr:hypothetical protein [Agromyces luteolus]MUN07036.1 hypothetical protein [Agromyces luteolus]
MARVAVVFLVTRLLFVAGFALAQAAMGRPISVGQMMVIWDGWWYTHLAEHGYPPDLTLPDRPRFGPWGFFPLWPWTIRLFDLVLPGGAVIAGTVAATVFGFAFLALVRLFTAQLFGDGAADAAVVLIAVFPGSIALALPYTEASFLFYVAGALLAARHDRWGLVALAAFLACATRSTGIALVIGLVVLGIAAFARRRDVRPWLASAGGVAGLALVVVFAWIRTGDPLIWFAAQRQWDQRFDFGVGLVEGFFVILPDAGAEYHAYAVMATMTVVFIILVALAAPLVRRLDLLEITYSVVVIGMVFAVSNVGPRPRMILAMLPLLILASARAHALGRGAALVLGTAFAVLSVAIAFATMFEPFHVTA